MASRTAGFGLARVPGSLPSSPWGELTLRSQGRGAPWLPALPAAPGDESRGSSRGGKHTARSAWRSGSVAPALASGRHRPRAGGRPRSLCWAGLGWADGGTPDVCRTPASTTRDASAVSTTGLAPAHPARLAGARERSPGAKGGACHAVPRRAVAGAELGAAAGRAAAGADGQPGGGAGGDGAAHRLDHGRRGGAGPA